MVGVGSRNISRLARVSIVDYNGNLIYDTIVDPEAEITHLRTKYSGMRLQDFSRAIPFQQARKCVKGILENRLIVGHTLKFDFAALGLPHPGNHLVRDIAHNASLRRLIEPRRSKQKIGLGKMTQSLFGVHIQEDVHCSIEDARASMAIFRLVESDWKSKNFRVKTKPKQLQSFDTSAPICWSRFLIYCLFLLCFNVLIFVFYFR